jgi:hypothetical protein
MECVLLLEFILEFFLNSLIKTYILKTERVVLLFVVFYE